MQVADRLMQELCTYCVICKHWTKHVTQIRDKYKRYVQHCNTWAKQIMAGDTNSKEICHCVIHT